MLARRLPSILPPLAPEEAIEVTRIQSVAGLRGGAGLVTARPFRAPHHTISAAGLVGGANPPQPGRGDARPPRRAVPRRALGVRAPEPGGAAAAARGRPRDDRPRPAGHGLPDELHARRGFEPVPVRPRRGAAASARRPTSSATDAASRARCWTAIDILMRVERPPADALRKQIAPTSAEVRERVIAARERQLHRLAGQRRGVQRAAHVAADPRGRPHHAERPAPAQPSSTTATRCPPVATRASCASRGRSPTSTAPTWSGPSTSSIAASLRFDDSHQLAEAA